MELSTKQIVWLGRISRKFEGYYLAFNGTEIGFCASSCDCCNSSLHGYRFKAVAMPNNQDNENIPLEVCSECINYIANGDIPDDDYID